VGTEQSIQVTIAGLTFEFALESVEPGAPGLHCQVDALASGPDSWLIRFTAAADVAVAVTGLTIRWTVAATDMHGFLGGAPWLADLVGLPFWEVHKYAAANNGIPFTCLFHRSGANRYAFGLVDQLTETDLACTLSESSRSYHFHWHKPPRTIPAGATWQEALFVSTAAEPWPAVLAHYRQVVDREWPQPHLLVPEHAYDPVFCSWTAVHHNVSQAWVLRNAQLAADLGFGTWLTDDGWFTEQASFADYRFTGDWQPCAARFPDFAGHVRAVQAMGLRYVLWVGPFMVGDESWAADRFANLLAHHDERLHYSQLSPWRRETGDIVADLLERLIVDFRLDGLKLDFIDAVAGDIARPPDADFASVGEGLYAILCRAVEQIAALRPGLLIELRSRYTNLAGRRYGNLYRASDVPINFAWNRWQVVMLRLIAPDRAVHLDPALWHPDDSDENVAVHLINLICSVPMVSIDLEQYPASHCQLIRTWIAFYQAHRQAIVHGRFEPLFRLGHVPLIRFTGAHERIVGIYDDIAFSPGNDLLPLWLLNASTRPFLELLPDDLAGPHTVTRYDKFGTIAGQETVSFPVARLPVEVGGYLAISAEAAT
jgi:alpha-galactosidase